MAEEPATASSLPRGEGPKLLQRSCFDCSRRKVRCNKQFPCDNCVRLGLECKFPPPGRKPRKAPKRLSNKAGLLSRLSLLEQEVKELGRKSVAEEPLEDHDTPQSGRTARSWLAKHSAGDGAGEPLRETEDHDFEIPPGSSPKTPSSTLEDQSGRLVVDRNTGTTRYLNDRVLVDFADQIKEVRELFESPTSPTLSEEDTPSPDPTTSYSEQSSSSIFGYHSVVHSLSSLHPPPIVSHLLFNVYEKNVAPIIMIIHKSALKNLLQTTSTNPDSLDKGSEALVFSIYFAAAYSMSPEQCLAQLGAEHTTLTKQYRFAVEQALVRAGFLHTRELVVLQAAVVFLSCACYPQDAHFVWAMIAVVTRLALGSGLHRDSSHFGLGPFETEMRRRLWWYIYLLDVRSSESQATSPQIREGDYDTRLPLNINDDDLSYDMVETPQERTGFTEMTLTLTRCEILTLHRKLMQPSSLGSADPNALFQNRIRVVEESRKSLDGRYLQFCDLEIAIHWVTATIARVALARSWLVSHFSLMSVEGFDPQLWPDQCDLLTFTAIEVLEFAYLLECHENTSKWAWLFQGYVQWQSFAFVLSELCVRPTSALSDRAWVAVDRVYERWNGPMGNRLGLMMRPLERLRNRAIAIRDEQSGQMRPNVPANHSADADTTIQATAGHMEEIPGDLLAVDAGSLDIFLDVLNNLGM